MILYCDATDDRVVEESKNNGILKEIDLKARSFSPQSVVLVIFVTIVCSVGISYLVFKPPSEIDKRQVIEIKELVFKNPTAFKLYFQTLIKYNLKEKTSKIIKSLKYYSEQNEQKFLFYVDFINSLKDKIEILYELLKSIQEDQLDLVKTELLKIITSKYEHNNEENLNKIKKIN
jgi:hypothetical protein